jgi:hypothetical protein
MADTDSTPIHKPQVYDLLGCLNGAFGKVHKNLDAIGNLGIFDPQTMQALHRMFNELRAASNSQMLSILRAIEERDLTHYRQGA